MPFPSRSAQRGGFFIGAAIYFAQPVFSSNPAFVSVVTQTATNPNTTITQTQSFDWSWQASPKAWLGYVCDNGWGFQFSFWHFQADPETLVVLHPADPPGIQTFGSTLGALPIPVRSNFPPIPTDVRERLFEKMVRGASPGSRPGSFGLGLYFCRRAVEAHGGRIWIGDRNDWPASFLMSFPSG